MNESLLHVDNISVAYNNNVVVSNIGFTLEQGEMACLIGPSGSGKSSILRAIAGFEPVQCGRIQLHGNTVSEQNSIVPPEQRKVGMLFQDLALFPHLTVQQNIAFGLVHLTKANRDAKIFSLLELVGLTNFSARYPHQLSGGQQQRVALARALAPDPDLLLLDEPFSSLDTDLRHDLAAEVRAILKKKNITTLMVTHDQTEAFSLADEIGVLHNGALLQWGSPSFVYHKPTSKIVADFIGSGNCIEGTVVNQNTINTAIGAAFYPQQNNKPTGSVVQVLLRPENIILDDKSPVKAKVFDRIFRGADSLFTLELGNGEKLTLIYPNSQELTLGEIVGITLSSQPVIVF